MKTQVKLVWDVEVGDIVDFHWYKNGAPTNWEKVITVADIAEFGKMTYRVFHTDEGLKPKMSVNEVVHVLVPIR